MAALGRSARLLLMLRGGEWQQRAQIYGCCATHEGPVFNVYANAVPSLTLHQVTPVTDGIRYSMTVWARGPDFRSRLSGAARMVEPETFTFLAELALNNRKAWMDEHREEFDDARRNFTGIAMTLHSYSHRFDHSVADAKSKPKQSHTKLYQDPQYRSGPGLYRANVDVFANVGNPNRRFWLLFAYRTGELPRRGRAVPALESGHRAVQETGRGGSGGLGSHSGGY